MAQESRAEYFRERRKIMKQFCVLSKRERVEALEANWSLCIILLAITLSACGGKQSPAPNDPIPAENEILDTDNPFLLANFSSAGVFSGSGGKRFL